MKPIYLTLISPKGDELEQRLLPDVQLAEAGTPSEEASRREGEMVSFARRVREILAADGMIVPMDDIALQLHAGRALLAASGTDHVQIRLPVQESPLLRPDRSDPNPGEKADEPPFDTNFLDRLFDLDGDDGADNLDTSIRSDQTEVEDPDE